MIVRAPELSALPTTRIWRIDPFHSSVRFAVSHHVIATYRAGFADFEGEYDAPNRRLVGATKVASIQAPFTEMYEHLMSEAFFDVDRHPTISFVSSAIDCDAGALAANGEMTMKGITRPVRAVGTVAGTSLVNQFDGTAHEHFGMDLDMMIDRREFGVHWNNTLLDGRINLGWDVRIQFSLELTTPAGTVDDAGRFVPVTD